MECNICMEDKNVFYYCDTCCKTLCVDCKETWKKHCPYCRAEYKQEDEIPVDLEVSINDDSQQSTESPDSQSSFVYSPRSISYIMTREQESEHQCRRATTLCLGLLSCGVLVYIFNPINFT